MQIYNLFVVITMSSLFIRIKCFNLNHIWKLRSCQYSNFKKSTRNPSLKLKNSLTNDDFYITTPIYYVNGDPHLGHAYTSVISDIIARFWKLDGKNVFFLSGTDEHGQKVEQSAYKANETPLSFADKVSNKFKNLLVLLNVNNNDFIRTTELRHKDSVKVLWNKLLENNQIYLGSYDGWYSIRDEAFYQESELINGKAPTGAEVEWVKEESYFFRLSNWTEKLLEFYDQNPDFIGPKSRRNEVISFVSQEGGLKDLSISRTTFKWGIPVPNDDKHVIYVWLDALTNYLSALGYSDNESLKKSNFWPPSLHIVGKDILRFHAVFWPAFLLAADIEPPKRVFAHGWWTKDGEKMSKSIGNVLDPIELVHKYGVDNLRYFLVSEVNFGNDGDFNDDAFIIRINSDLANDIGNLCQRVLTFIQKSCDEKIPTCHEHALTDEDREILRMGINLLPRIRVEVTDQNMKQMVECIISISRLGNKYIDTQAPWTLRKNGDIERMETVLFVLAEILRQLGILLQPIIPYSSNLILNQLGVPQDQRTFHHLVNNRIMSGQAISQPEPVFPKLEAISSTSSPMSTVNPDIENPSTATKDKKKKKESGLNRELLSSFQSMNLSLNEIVENIVKVSNDIKVLKANPDADKEAVKANVEQLLAWKEYYKLSNGGVPYESQ